MFNILLFSLNMALAQSSTIAPSEGTLWDFIENRSIAQGLDFQENQHQGEDGIANTLVVLPKYLMAQSIEMVDYAFYEDPIKTLEHDPLFIDMIDPKDFDIPIVINDDVKAWMNYLLGPGRKHYAKWLARSTKFTPMMHQKLEAAGLPKDMIYLSMIESGFSTAAYSSAAAVGLWQFIPTTGREMGLRVDWWIDERRDPETSTDAAIKYLSRLYRNFDDWYLVWAGYNGGPGRVSRAIPKYGTKDFWELKAQNAFPSETDNYVPKIIAAAIIGKYRERYGFTDIQYQSPLEFDEATIDGNVSIEILAKCMDISVSEFKAYNPHILQSALPATPSKQTIKLPKDKKEGFIAELATIPPEKRLTHQRHVIKKGETLGVIAKQYGVSVQQLQTTNSISNPNRIHVGQVIMIPTGAPPQNVQLTSSKGSSSTTPAKSSSSSTGQKSKETWVSHTVKSGENLNVIADKYGVSVSDVKRWNNIKNANKIYVGQKIKILSSKPVWTTYTVKSGDNLTKIATQYGVSVADIQSWNNLSSTKIYVGQKIKIQQ